MHQILRDLLVDQILEVYEILDVFDYFDDHQEELNKDDKKFLEFLDSLIKDKDFSAVFIKKSFWKQYCRDCHEDVVPLFIRKYVNWAGFAVEQLDHCIEFQLDGIDYVYECTFE